MATGGKMSATNNGSKSDEKSASLRSTLNKGSEMAFDFYCDLCIKDDIYFEAVGYCSDCMDYLCQECYNHHLRPKPSQHHVLLDQHKMPKATSQRQSKDMCTEPCTEHTNKTLKYYCTDHKKFGCGVCMTLHHRSCEGVGYIPEISGDVLTSREYKDMNLKLRELINTSQQAINTTQQKTQTSNQQHSNASEFFKQLKQDLIAAVGMIEILTITYAGKIRDENQESMKSVENQCNQLLKDIGALDSKFTSLENKGQHSQIFLSMKRSQDEIASLETSLLQLQDQINITEYEVKINDGLQNLIQRPKNMTSLKIIKNPQTSSQAAHSILSSQPKIQINSIPDHTKPSTKPQPTEASADMSELEEQKTSIPGHTKPSTKPQPTAASVDMSELEEQMTSIPGHTKPKPQPTAASADLSETEEQKTSIPYHTKPKPQPTAASADMSEPEEHKTSIPGHTKPSTKPQPTAASADLSETEEQKTSIPDHTKPKPQPTAASADMSEPEEHKTSIPDQTKPKLQSIAANTAESEPDKHKKSAAVHVADIDVRMDDDKRDPNITGSVVLPGDKLVIVDSNNSKVKLINLQRNKIIDHHLQYGVSDIAAVTNTQVAVTFPLCHTILFINVTNTLTLDHKVEVNGKCWGIACISNEFVITYSDPPKVEIISQKGKLLQTVVPKNRSRQLFTDADYVAVSPDQQTLYISDYKRGTVISLDLKGQVKAIYKDERLQHPQGLTVDRAGVLYVCGQWSFNIHQLTPDLHKIQIPLQQSDGIESPFSVSYNEEQNKLYIGQKSVKVYLLQ